MCVLISKHGVFLSGVSLGIKTHPADQNRHHLLAGHFMNYYEFEKGIYDSPVPRPLPFLSTPKRPAIIRVGMR